MTWYDDQNQNMLASSFTVLQSPRLHWLELTFYKLLNVSCTHTHECVRIPDPGVAYNWIEHRL